MEYDSSFNDSSEINDESFSLDSYELSDTSNVATSSFLEVSSSNKINYRSKVWNHFTKDSAFNESKKVSCNYCSTKYTCSGGSTSNLFKHLEKNHPIKLNPTSDKPLIENFFNTTVVSINIFIKFKTMLNLFFI